MRKKIIPYIFIVLVLMNLFAPFSVGMDGNNSPVVNKSVAEADDPQPELNIVPSADGTSATASGTFWITDDGWITNSITGLQMSYAIGKSSNRLSADGFGGVTHVKDDKINGNDVIWYSYNYTFKGLTPGQTYYAVANIIGSVLGAPIANRMSAVVSFVAGGQAVSNAGTSVLPLPPCGLSLGIVSSVVGLGSGTISGCMAQILYYVVFIPTSYIFALTGQIFDFTFFYSVSDGSYRSPFVLQGWGVVRDFVNLFFIFVLLYVAFATILEIQIHGSSSKTMIINVVIIGLLINFSLFAAQVVIDTSNILARVFYNSNTITITQPTQSGVIGASGVTNATPGLKVGPSGEIPLSAAIVNKVNPQNLIINSSKISDIQNKGGVSDSPESFSATTFILVTLLATAVNVIGIIVFISIAMMCITRVIGLWLYMVLAPLAFFSYTVPQMQGLKMIGWKNWWSQLLCYSFWAPLLIFFLYLIVEFLGTGLNLINVQGQTGVAFVVATVVPFAFIMMLLWKAKGLAKSMGCEAAEQITGGIATLGGLALGGAALGTAFAGRRIIGAGMAKASKTEGAKNMMKYRQDLKDYQSGKRSDDGKLIHESEPVKPKIGFISKIGDTLNRKQEKVGEVDHARGVIDDMKDKAHINKDVPDANLSAVDEKRLKDVYSKEKRSEAEAIIRKDGYKDDKGNSVLESEDSFKAKNRDSVAHEVGLDPSNIDHATGELTDAAKKKVENKLSADFNVKLNTVANTKLGHDFDHLRGESKTKVSGYDRVISNSNKSSYDVRNLSQTKVDRREGLLTRVSAGLIAGIAMGVRTGIKTSGINHGSGQADILKDIGHTITEALKSIKVNVKIEESHGKSGADVKGGGHN